MREQRCRSGHRPDAWGSSAEARPRLTDGPERAKRGGGRQKPTLQHMA